MRWLCVLSSFKFRFKTRQVRYTYESFIIESLLSSKFLVPEQVLSAAWRRSSLILFWCRWVCWCSSCTISGLSIPSCTTLFELLLALMQSLVINGFSPSWVWVLLYIITFFSLSFDSWKVYALNMCLLTKFWLQKDHHITIQVGHW